jgi:hypothetical protein
MNNDANDQACAGGCGANSKWSQTTAAINTVVGMTDTTIDWGLKFFPSSTAACGVTTTTEAPIAPSNATTIAAALAGYVPGGNTPTRVTIQNSVAYLQTLTDTNPKFLLLATDGLPNCLPGGSPNNDDSAGAIQAVADALTAGYPTFVVGIGIGATGAATLDSMAVAGGRPQMGAPTSYYPTSSTADLVAALDKIVGSAGSGASCVFDLGNPPSSMASNSAINVFGDQNQLPKDPTHGYGWDYSMGTSQITIYGAACQGIQAGTIKSLTITYVCQP